MPLDDTERKVLRILYNNTHSGGKPPSLNTLSVRTGKAPLEIERVLQSLTDQGFIDWSPDRHSELQVIQPWEDRQMIQIQKRTIKAEPWEMESF